MKRLMGAGVLVLALFVTIQPAMGFGRRGGNCAPSCEPAPVLGSCGTVYVDQVVTGYRSVTKERLINTTVDQVVCKTVADKVKVTVYEPYTKKEKVTQTWCELVSKPVAYEYYVTETVAVPEKVKQTTYQTVAEEVPVTYTTYKPVMTKQKQLQTTYQCVQETVMTQVPVCSTVQVACTDRCGNCYTVCKPVTTYQCVPRTVSKMVPVVTEVMVDVCSYQAVQTPGKQTVYKCVPVTKDVDVVTYKCVQVKKVGTYNVCEYVTKSKEVEVDVVYHKAVEKDQTVYKVVHETVKVPVTYKQYYCEMEPYTYTVKVACQAPVLGCNGTVCTTGCCK